MNNLLLVLGKLTLKCLFRIFPNLYEKFPILLQIRKVRETLTRLRLDDFVKKHKIKQFDTDPEKSAFNTLQHNIEGLMESAELDRTSWMLGPILSIEKVFKNIKNMQILSVGPRSEMEIFTIMANGFVLENISSIDLFSYSPYIEVADMHDLPYPDDMFDIIMLGWVISYSKDWSGLRDEILKCIKPGGLIAISADYSSPDTVSDKFHHEAGHVQSCQQILDLFAASVDRVYFRHDAVLPEIRTNLLVFDVKK